MFCFTEKLEKHWYITVVLTDCGWLVHVCYTCIQSRGVVASWCRLLSLLSHHIQSSLSYRLSVVLFYSISISALPLVFIASCQSHQPPCSSIVLQYWPLSCMIALSSVSLFIAASCYVKLALMIAATLTYNLLVSYLTSGHVFHHDDSSTTR